MRTSELGDGSDSRFDFGLVGIGELLSRDRLAVPIYQRSYSWGNSEDGSDQIDEFWSDIYASFRDAGTEYFLGTIVLAREGSSRMSSVVDGQQRLATTTLLLAAIRDEFEERGDQRRGAIIHQRYIAKDDLETASATAQLKLNSEDDVFFYSLVADRKSVEPNRRSHELISRAYTKLKEKVKNFAESHQLQYVQELLSLAEFLRSRLRVIVVSVPSEADAFLIFEALNDRGVDLTIADLLKNYLFSRAGDRLDSVRDAWIAASANLDVSADGGEVFTSFLRHFWSSLYGATRERELYAEIKKRVVTSTHAVEFAEKLQVASRLYAALLSSEHEFWSTVPGMKKDCIDVLEVLKLEQNKPLMLAAMQHIAKENLAELMDQMVSWGVRGIIYGGIGGGTAERAYCSAAMSIRSGDVKSIGQIRSALATILPTNAQFRAGFLAARITRAPLARYLLLALERAVAADPEPELVPNEDSNQVNLEHILPKNAREADWRRFTDDQRRSDVNRIGNFALMKKTANSKIGNKSFSDKKKVFSASDLTLTVEVGQESSWSSAAIDRRQRRLAELALETWQA